MSDFLRFVRIYLRLLHHVQGVVFMLIAALVACAALIAGTEDMSFGDALYFTLITGLTVGYGDITPESAAGRVLSIVGGVIGVIFAGIVVAVATRALRDSVEEERAKSGKTGDGD